ncbi:MAG: hypothetical protein IJ068_07060 [Bacilli bacterium]|nr:hypothetical protein [Bacilli bacterium]
MGKKLKKYILFSIVISIIKYLLLILFLTIGCIDFVSDSISFILIVIDLFCIIRFIYIMTRHACNIKHTNLDDYKKVEKKLNDPIIMVPRNYILTDTYIVNLKNSHLFKYKDISTMYKRIGFRLITNKSFGLAKYLYTVTKDNKKDRFIIGYVGFLNTVFQDFSDIIMKKNMFVNFDKNRK